MNCTSAAFDNRRSARRLSDALTVRRYPLVKMYLCGKCDRFHPRGKFPNTDIGKHAARVLRLSAMGFNAETVSEMTGYTPFTVKKVLHELRISFGALNNPHLVAIAIVLGYLDPNEFVPPVVEKELCNDRT